jgi:hypothetical protein
LAPARAYCGSSPIDAEEVLDDIEVRVADDTWNWPAVWLPSWNRVERPRMPP